jgi:hypothetical protein
MHGEKNEGLLEYKESWPCPGFDFSPEGWWLPSANQWNNGMVEKWNIGYDKRMLV